MIERKDEREYAALHVQEGGGGGGREPSTARGGQREAHEAYVYTIVRSMHVGGGARVCACACVCVLCTEQTTSRALKAPGRDG